VNVGFVGLGVMGRPMAANLCRRGFEVYVHDCVASAVAALSGLGARPCPTPRAVAESSEAVITMLPNGPDVEAVVLGPEGVAAGMKPGGLVVDMSPVDPEVTRRAGRALEARGLRMLDAPVGRSSAHAAQGKLLIMVGGAAEDLERMRPAFEAMGDTVIHCGPLGSGEAMKLVNNYLSIAAAAITSEALVLGAKAGLGAELMLRVLTGTLATNGHLTAGFPARILRGDTEPGFTIDLAHKDLGLALGMGARLGVPLAGGAVCRELYTHARAAGKGRLDWSAVLTVVEEVAGCRVRLQEIPAR
jgi:4-hydroxybutyrate dehydrogenase/sulfolactaldehyde 3-reductase